MPYDLELEKRIERLITGNTGIEKKKMFGGVGYMLRGNMVFGITKDMLLMRVSPEQADELLKQKFVKVFDMTVRPMKGWITVAPEGIPTEKQLKGYLDLCIEYNRTLPAK